MRERKRGRVYFWQKVRNNPSGELITVPKRIIDAINQVPKNTQRIAIAEFDENGYLLPAKEVTRTQLEDYDLM